MKLDIRELLNGEPVRLRYVNRYSTCRVNHQETVAEHSFFVGYYSLMIGLWCVRQGYPILWSMLMQKSLIHDTEEARSGDWPRHFKHSDPQLTEQLNRVAQLAFRQMMCKLWEVELTERSDPLSLVTSWNTAKSDGLEGAIVALADFLAVLSYVAQEHASGNMAATEHVQHLDEYFHEFDDPCYAPLTPLIADAGIFLQELFAVCRRSVVKGTEDPGVRQHATEPGEPGTHVDRHDPAALPAAT